MLYPKDGGMGVWREEEELDTLNAIIIICSRFIQVIEKVINDAENILTPSY